MAKKYLLKSPTNTKSPDTSATHPSTVEVISMQEFADTKWGSADVLETLRSMIAVKGTYLDMFPACTIGSFAIPDKQHIMDEPFCFGFYLDKSHLVFIDEGDLCNRILDIIAKAGILERMTPAHCLFECMKQVIKDDLPFLSELEDHMEDIEEAIIDRHQDGVNRAMLGLRRKLLRINAYYQQLVDMGSTLAENENHLVTREESRLFLSLSNQVDRLLRHSQTLKEYSLQLRELYQTQIDIQQNKIMKLFAVITALFAPLMLITSWFGMNYENMPGSDWHWGYTAIIVGSIAIIVVELIVFRKKKWL